MSSSSVAEWKTSKGYRVRLYLYDLSQGMAAAMSPGLVGKLIEGIWHTSTVVYGTEYFYGGGIQSSVPNTTPYGRPVRVIEMGFTSLTQSLFHDYLNEVSSRFSPAKYNLLKHNCNNFSDECMNFLLGKHIPSFITGLPDEVMATPFGAMIKPMYEQMDLSMRQQLGRHFDDVRPNLPSVKPIYDEFLEIDDEDKDTATVIPDTFAATSSADTDKPDVSIPLMGSSSALSGTEVVPVAGIEMPKSKIPRIADSLLRLFKDCFALADHKHLSSALGLTTIGLDFEPKLSVDPRNASMYASVVSKSCELTSVQQSHLNDLVRFVESKGGVRSTSSMAFNEDCLETLDELILMTDAEENSAGVFGLVSLLRLLCVHSVVFERYRDLTIVEQIVYKCGLPYNEELPSPPAGSGSAALDDSSSISKSVLSPLGFCAQKYIDQSNPTLESESKEDESKVDLSSSAIGGSSDPKRQSLMELLQFTTFGALSNLFGVECLNIYRLSENGEELTVSLPVPSLLDFAFNALCNSLSFNVRLSVIRFLYNCALQLKFELLRVVYRSTLLALGGGAGSGDRADLPYLMALSDEMAAKVISECTDELNAILHVCWSVIQHEEHPPNRYRLWTVIGLIILCDDEFVKYLDTPLTKETLMACVAKEPPLTISLAEDVSLLVN